jgi:2-keto-4-pentenoate hydratase/2-oxohepta-3-ene-1,7-dioic acid hydratase in catechol pathway
MGMHVVRFVRNEKEKWGVLSGDRILVLRGSYPTLANFLEEGIEEARSINEQRGTESISLDDVTILSPVTKPAKIICQGANYSTHRVEAGLEAGRPSFNLIFSKADSSLTGAYSDIICPSPVKLLDYEIELGLVIGTAISGPVQVTDETLDQYVVGLVITNDVSARDIQLSQGQFLKGKSYRTFCPTGPSLYLLDKEEIPLIHDLELKLWVNDELRQAASTEQLLFKPAETLTELSEIMDLSIGDLIMTGTTGGVALNLTAEMMSQISNQAISSHEKLDLLLTSQLKSEKYLKAGDVIRCVIKSKDGTINLGEQVNKVIRQDF